MPVINALRLTDFRSYEALDLELDGRPVVLFGQNGAGKTNLMEAVSLLTPGRGLRGAKPDEVARISGDKQAGAWGVVATISPPDAQDEAFKLAVGQVPENPRRRLMRLNSKSVTGTQVAALMPMMWLTPAQDRLFTGPASDRRKFLDRFCLSYVPSHGTAFLRYEKARAERNRLLSDGVNDDFWYDALERDMALYGAQVAVTRAETVQILSADIERRVEGAFPKARLALDGEAEQAAQSGEDISAIEAAMSERLKRDRGSDLRAGRTQHGIHKSDLLVTHAPKNMPAKACSTGEQKALLIGLVLAQARAQADKQPILLLDEVAAHLDELRRAAMAEELLGLGTQAFLTGTDRNLFEAFGGRAQIFRVEAGALSAVN